MFLLNFVAPVTSSFAVHHPFIHAAAWVIGVLIATVVVPAFIFWCWVIREIVRGVKHVWHWITKPFRRHH